MTAEQIKEYTLKITRANKSELIVVIYDMAIDYVDDALRALENGDKNQYRKNVKQARRCVTELLEALNYDYEPSYPLMRIYIFVNKQLTQSMSGMKTEGVYFAKRTLEKLRESFENIAKEDTSEPLMANTEKVYAGLTYGKSSLNENISGSGNRGFCV